MSHGDFEEVVRLASCAPSWKNTQTARYTLVEDREVILRLADEGMMGFSFNTETVRGAPAVVIVSYITGRSGFEKDGSYTTSKGDRWEMFDAGIATQTFCLAAHSMGYGTVIMGVFDEARVQAVAGISGGQTVAAVVPIGLPSETPAMPRRKAVEELVSYR